MNYLQLAQRLRRRCRVIGSGPSAITGQSEEYNRLLDFINESWMSIQELHPNWLWMRNSMSFPTVDGQPTYTLAQIESTGTGFSEFGNWVRDSFRVYLTATGLPDEKELGFITYDRWRDLYQIGTLRTANSQPDEFTILPALGIGLGPTPLAGYTISGDYYKVATELAQAGDTPGMPAQFHMLIVYRAMMLYGADEAANEVYQTGQNLYREMLGALELQQLPELEVGEGLV